ncbi:cupin domain-containing protein [[Actinomadura] parvosata]|uniref:cupin domain-containing protein n=1 Tax=[Actinomadura] parvosata TaxID=1955412 RepID=UPI00406CA8CB
MLWEREDGSEVGAVWEMTPGVLDDVQGNEAFVIVSGRSRVDFPDGRVLEFGPGDAGVLAPGDTSAGRRWRRCARSSSSASDEPPHPI